MFLEGNYDAMVNYESLIIAANRELTAAGREPLYAVYPYDGLTVADSPLAYVDTEIPIRKRLFLKCRSIFYPMKRRRKSEKQEDELPLRRTIPTTARFSEQTGELIQAKSFRQSQCPQRIRL